jgi:universal stress protein E
MHEHDKPASLDQVIVETANAIAGPTGGEIQLVHTYERLAGIGSAANRTINAAKLPIDQIDQRIKAEHRTALDALATKNGIDADHTHQFPGRTRDIIPTFVRGRNVDLVVMGALARWGIKRMVIGSTAERILDHLPCDVFIVRDNDLQIAKPINIEPAAQSV